MLYLPFELRAHPFGYLNAQSCVTVWAWLLVDEADIKVFFSSLRDTVHNFSYYPIAHLHLLQQDCWQKCKGLRRSGAAASKNPQIKDAPQKFSEGSFMPTRLAGESRGHCRPCFWGICSGSLPSYIFWTASASTSDQEAELVKIIHLFSKGMRTACVCLEDTPSLSEDKKGL